MTGMRVALNTAIDKRGPSGTSTAVAQIRTVFDDWSEGELLELSPTGRASARVGRLASSWNWDFRKFARRASLLGADVLVFPTNVGWPKKGQKSIVVMHDVMVLEHAGLFDPGYRASALLGFPLTVARSDVIVTPSQASATAIRRRFSPQHVEVIPWFAPERRARILPLEDRADSIGRRNTGLL